MVVPVLMNIKNDEINTQWLSRVLKMAKSLLDNLLMKRIWGLLNMTFVAILANMAWHPGKARIACPKSRLNLCNKLTKVV